ncbi:Cytosolic protein [Flavobacterium longum]|uniref:IS1096 element passenger TnpR family protein n=1 Tax=Flavobacterium longum TaxID=1299340 RepID=UPI0039ECC977
MIYKFRVILDTEEDVFRDIAIASDDSLEDLHNAIVNAFGFDGSELASFYTCDESWNQEDEISLFDGGDVPGEQKIMSDYALSELLNEDQTKIIYVYDFMNMWTFFVELAAMEEPQPGESYPSTLFAHGEMPADAPEKEFGTDENEFDFDDDDYDEDDLDAFGDNENFEDFGFEENWN